MKRLLRKFISFYLARKERNQYLYEMVRLDKKLEKFCEENQVSMLPEHEHQIIQAFWKPYIHYDVAPYYYSMLNCFTYKNPIYQAVNESIMFNCIVRKLNPLEAARVLANKGMYSLYFHDVHRPHEFFRNCNDILYNQNNQITSVAEMIEYLLDEKPNFIIKPSVDSHRGRNVRVFTNYNEQDLKTLFEQYTHDFVIQKLVNQSAQTKIINPTSLNTFRIITLLLNGKVTVLSSILRCGGKDSLVDNATSGGMFIGIDSNGVLSRGTSFKRLLIEESAVGFKFANHKIHHFDRVLELAKQLHTRIPLCAFAGWDIALDENNQPIFIEVNLNKPDIWLMQVLNGPIFGDRFDEVMDYCFQCNKQSDIQ